MTKTKGTLGILEVGRPPDTMTGYPGYGQMSADWLAPLGLTPRIWAFDRGEVPGGPDAADLWLVTGSKYGVYDDQPWIAGLEQFIRDCRTARRPMVGICFGHQVIASALGGVARKSDNGYGLGIHDYTVTDWPDTLGPAPDGLHLQAFHQDQVESAPAEAAIIASSPFCPIAALWYPDFALTVQGHPEFDNQYSADLLREKRGAPFPADRTDAALASQNKPDNRHALVETIRHALLESRSPGT